jgi:nucleoid DNA-binding protein
MTMHRNWLRGILLGVVGLVLALASPAQSQRPPKELTLTQRLAKAAKVPEADATRLFEALGPVIRDELQRGKQVELPGLGTFRVVQVAAHKDLAKGGRPITIPATNTIEFVPDDKLNDTANSAGAKPADTVPAFEYVTLPHQQPGQKMGRTRVPSTRTP